MVSIGSHERQSEVAGNSGNASQSAKSFSWMQHVATTWGPQVEVAVASSMTDISLLDSISYPRNHAVVCLYLHVDVCNLSGGRLYDAGHLRVKLTTLSILNGYAPK